MFDISSELTIKILGQCQWRRSGVFIYFEQILQVFWAFLSLNFEGGYLLGSYMSYFWRQLSVSSHLKLLLEKYISVRVSEKYTEAV